MGAPNMAASMIPGQRIAVAHIGPDARGRGGMAAVTRALTDTALAEEFRLQPITTHRPGGRAARALTFARALARFVVWARRPGRRLAHVHATVRGSLYRKVLVVVVAKVLGVPVLLHVHAGAAELIVSHRRFGPVRRRAVRAVLRSADRVIAVSAASARVLERSFGARPVEVLENPAPRPGAPRNGSAPPEVLYLGGFANPVKGGEVLLKALPALRARAPQVRITLAGPGEPSPASFSPVADDSLVAWAGWLDEDAKWAALARAAVVVLPSTSEGLPMALLEAMAAGAPIVATRVGGVPDVAVDGREALLVGPGDPAALADAIATLLDDPERARRLGDAARDRAAGLSPDVIARRLACVYREVADGE